jgi:transposase-like protein
VNPRTITVDKNAAYPAAVTAMKRDGELWRFSRLRRVKYLNNIVEQDHRRMKRLVGRVSALAVCQRHDERWLATRGWR